MEIEEKKIQLPENSKKIRFLLNSNFYNIEDIREALNNFKGICEGFIGKVENDKVEIILQASDSFDLELIKNEFCNYSLGLMKNNMHI
jgi:hypothetical protein